METNPVLIALSSLMIFVLIAIIVLALAEVLGRWDGKE